MVKNKLFLILISASFLFWAFMTFLFILRFGGSFVTISSKDNIKSIYQIGRISNSGRFLQFDLRAQENYFGSITLNLNDIKILNHGYVYFKIKDKSNPNWYYQNKYEAEQIKSLENYPFGFPIINNSQHRIYTIRLEYINNQLSHNKNKFTVSEIVTKYQFPRAVILRDIKFIFEFVFAKIKYSFGFNETIIASLFYSIPLLIILFINKFYNSLFYKLHLKQYEIIHSKTILQIANIVFLISSTVFYNIIMHNSKELFFLIFIIIFIYFRKIKPYQLYIVSTVNIILGLLVFMINFTFLGNNLVTWGYYFLILAAVLNFKEYVYNRNLNEK